MLYGELPEVKLPNGETARAIRVSVPNPPKAAFVQLPTNEQLTARLDQQKSVRRSLGRRKSQTEYTPNLKADLELFNAIRVDKDGQPFDEYEGANALGKLTAVSVTGCVPAGDSYVITLKTAFGETKHTAKGPSLRELEQYRQAAISIIDLPHGMEEINYKIDPAVKLYDATIQKIEGYAPSYTSALVPPNHKSAVVVELVQAIEEIDISIDPNS